MEMVVAVYGPFEKGAKMKKNNIIKACALGVTTILALSACTEKPPVFCIPYDGDGGVDSGCPIEAAELNTLGYKFPNELVENANHTQLANHAWRMFIAANLPSKATLQSGTGRAAPDPTKKFNDSAQPTPQTNPTVWESFYHRAEAFPFYKLPKYPKPNDPENQIPTYYYHMDGQPLTVSGQNYVNLDENNQVAQNMLYYNTATDPNFPILYMAKVNNVELNYVWDKQPGKTSASLSFPHPVVNGPESKTVSTIEVKSAWRRLSDIPDTSTHGRYHQAEATYYVDKGKNPTPMTETFALVALHIIQKTNNYRTFIFSTFEHVDNVVTDQHGTIIDPQIDLKYDTLVYGVDTPLSTNAYGAYSVNEPGQSGQANVKTNYTLPPAGTQPSGRFPVKRLKTISAEVNDVNNHVASLMPAGSVWKNYRLKGVQGVPTSYPIENGTVALDYYLASIVVESSQPGLQLFAGQVHNPNKNPLKDSTRCGYNIQNPATSFTNCRALPNDTDVPGPNLSPYTVASGPVPPPKWTMGGCMGCHGVAQQFGQDMSFLGFSMGGNGFSPDSVAPKSHTDSEREALYRRITNRTARRLSGYLEPKETDVDK
jgi:hypothetical protein